MPVHVSYSLADAVEQLERRPDAIVLAGGTDFMVEVNEGHRTLPTADVMVIAVDRVAELRSFTIDDTGKTLTLGAGVTYAEIMGAPIASRVPALAEAARTVGSPQIRHAATVGGNLATCSPAGDGLPVLSALDAVVNLVSASGERSMSVHDFMVGVKRTALLPGELIASIGLPILDGYQGYSKVGVRNAMVIATASVCVAIDNSDQSVRCALGSVAPTIIRCPEAEAYASANVDWREQTVESSVCTAFGTLAADASRPIDDHRSSAAYRKHSIAVMASRQLGRAFASAGPAHMEQRS